MNLKAIYTHYLRGDQAAARNLLQKISTDREMSLEDLLTELEATFGSDPSAIDSSPSPTPSNPDQNVSFYVSSAGERVLLFATASTALGWKRYMEVEVRKDRKANRRFTFHNLTSAEVMYMREMVPYYLAHWNKMLEKNGLKFPGLGYADTATLLGRSKDIHMKVVMGATFSFIQANKLQPDDYPTDLTGVKRRTYNTLSQTDLQIEPVARLVKHSNRVGPVSGRDGTPVKELPKQTKQLKG